MFDNPRLPKFLSYESNNYSSLNKKCNINRSHSNILTINSKDEEAYSHFCNILPQLQKSINYFEICEKCERQTIQIIIDNMFKLYHKNINL